MKIKRLSAIVFALTVGLSCSGALFGQKGAIAQTMPPQTMLNALASRCNRATEVTYRSQQLASPDGTMQVHAEGLLRKIVSPTSQLRQADTDNHCYADSRETVSRQIVIEDQTGVRRFVDTPYDQGYILYQPRAFSIDSRFLAVDMQVAYTGHNPGNYVVFLDVENDESVQVSGLCQNLGFQSYAGFASATEVVVLCQDFGATVERFELVSLTDGSVRPLTSRPEGLVGYGRITRDFAVTQAQMFE